MKNRFLKTLLAVVALTATLLALATAVYADASLKLSASDSVAIGKTVTVSVSMLNETQDLSAFSFDLQYDTKAFSFVSASVNGSAEKNDSAKFIETPNNLQIEVANYKISDPTILTIKFNANAVISNDEFSLKNTTLVKYDPVEEILATSSGPITISIFQPSANADLSKLAVAPGTLSPAFTNGNTVYTVQVADGINALTVDAVPADAKANVTVTGQKSLKNGENLIKIVVIAENGATKTYTINAIKAVSTPAPSPTPSATVQMDGKQYSVAELAAGQSQPAGFEAALISLQGKTVPAYVGFGGMTILYLKDSAGKSEFYMYDTGDGSFSLFQTVVIPAKSYIILIPDASLAVPTGFMAATLTIDKGLVHGFKEVAPGTDGISQILIYLMDSNGTKSLYEYNASTGELQLYSEQTKTPVSAITPTPTAAVTLTPTPSPAPAKPDANAGSNSLLIIVLAILVAVLTGILIYLLIARKAYVKSQSPQMPTIKRID